MNRNRLAAITVVSLVALLGAGCSDDDDDGNQTTASGGAGGNGGTGAAGGGGGNAGGGNPGAGGATGGGTAQGGSGGEASGGTGGGTGGEGGGSGASKACNDCVADVYTNDRTCAANIDPCDDDAACNAWKDCNEGCFAADDSPGCYDGCDTMHPHDDALSDPLLTCTCAACGELCVNACAD